MSDYDTYIQVHVAGKHFEKLYRFSRVRVLAMMELAKRGDIASVMEHVLETSKHHGMDEGLSLIHI